MQAVRLIAQKRRADGIDKRLKRMPFVAISRFQKPSDVFGKGEQLAIAIRTRSDLYIRLIAVQCDISAAPPGKQPFFRAVHFIHLLHGEIAVRVSQAFLYMIDVCQNIATSHGARYAVLPAPIGGPRNGRAVGKASGEDGNIAFQQNLASVHLRTMLSGLGFDQARNHIVCSSVGGANDPMLHFPAEKTHACDGFQWGLLACEREARRGRRIAAGGKGDCANGNILYQPARLAKQ